jgi:hypothetical protein
MNWDVINALIQTYGNLFRHCCSQLRKDFSKYTLLCSSVRADEATSLEYFKAIYYPSHFFHRILSHGLAAEELEPAPLPYAKPTLDYASWNPLAHEEVERWAERMSWSLKPEA